MNRFIALAAGAVLSGSAFAMQGTVSAGAQTESSLQLTRERVLDSIGVHPPQFQVLDSIGVHPPQFQVLDSIGVHPPQFQVLDSIGVHPPQ